MFQKLFSAAALVGVQIVAVITEIQIESTQIGGQIERPEMMQIPQSSWQNAEEKDQREHSDPRD